MEARDWAPPRRNITHLTQELHYYNCTTSFEVVYSHAGSNGVDWNTPGIDTGPERRKGREENTQEDLRGT